MTGERAPTAGRNPFDLSGRVALVTGANGGLGLGFAEGIARAGGDVVIWGRRADRNAAAVELLRAYGTRVIAQEVDVADEAAVRCGFAEAVEAMGRIDGFVANAGISLRTESFTAITSEQYHQWLAVNLHGAFFGLQEAVKHMQARFEREGVGGSIVTCGSLSVVAGVPRIQPYVAAKGALAAITRSLAVEYGPSDIRVNMVMPGRIVTDLGGGTGGMDEAKWRGIPLPRLGTPADCAGIVVYLLSDAARYHTGTSIAVDGGLSVALRG